MGRGRASLRLDAGGEGIDAAHVLLDDPLRDDERATPVDPGQQAFPRQGVDRLADRHPAEPGDPHQFALGGDRGAGWPLRAEDLTPYELAELLVEGGRATRIDRE